MNFQIWPGILDHEKPFRGVSQAHKQIVRFAQKEGLPNVLISEDDIKFTALGAFDYFLEKEPPSYDLYLGGISYGEINPDRSVKDFAGTMFYKINQNFYDTFLSIPEDGHLDRNLKNQGHFIVCHPFIVTQYNGYSDNKKGYFNSDLYFKDRELFVGKD